MMLHFLTMIFLLHLLNCCSSGSDSLEGCLIQSHSSNTVFFVRNAKKLTVWNPDTVDALNMTWGDVFHIAQWIIDIYPTGPNLNVYESSFATLVSGIRCALNSSEKVVDSYNFFQSETKTNTIIVVYGQYRTFDLTCISIFEHIVIPNIPAKVIISLDGPESMVIEGNGRRCVDAYLGQSITIIINRVCHQERPARTVEFCLVEKAIEHLGVEVKNFDYLLAVRSDNFIKADIRVATAFATHPNFFNSFLQFEEELELEHEKRGLATPSLPDRLWAWVFTAGIPAFIVPMLFEPNESPFCLINATQWNKNMKDFIYSLPLPVHSPTERGFYFKYHRTVSAAMHNITSNFNLFYLIGSTWVYFSRVERVSQVNRNVQRDWGKLVWNETTRKDEWRDATESQLRLTLWNAGYNLVDLVNQPDYKYSFDGGEKMSLVDNIRRRGNKLIVWIHRGCAHHAHRNDC